MKGIEKHSVFSGSGILCLLTKNLLFFFLYVYLVCYFVYTINIISNIENNGILLDKTSSSLPF